MGRGLFIVKEARWFYLSTVMDSMGEPGHWKRHRERKPIRRFFLIVLGGLITLPKKLGGFVSSTLTESMGEQGHWRYWRHRKRKLIRRLFLIALGALVFMGLVLLIIRNLVGPASPSPSTPPDSGGDNSAVQYK
jgi:hypothetical protein